MRLHNPKAINKEEVINYLKDNGEVIIQFSGKYYNNQTLADINELCAIASSKLEVRFYSDKNSSFDAKTLRKIRNVKYLTLDNLKTIENSSILNELTYLERFSLHIDESKDQKLLAFENFKTLHQLDISICKNANFNLEYLSGYTLLETLRLFGNSKQISEIGNIKNLKNIEFWYVPKSVSLEFINKVSELKELSLTLGGRENLHELAGGKIEILKLNQVRGFKDLSNLSNFKNLQELKLVDLAQLAELNFPLLYSFFRDLSVFNCRNLLEISGLYNLPFLEKLTLSNTNIDFETFITKTVLPKTLKILAFYTDKVRRNAEIYKYLKSLGYYQSIVELDMVKQGDNSYRSLN